MRHVVYAEYIQSSQWNVRRAKAIIRAEGKCSLCGSAKFLNVHHNTYERLGQEAASDLVVLCKTCHDCFHVVRDDRTRDKASARLGVSNPPPKVARLAVNHASDDLPIFDIRRRMVELVSTPPLVEVLLTIDVLDSWTSGGGGITMLATKMIGENWPPRPGWYHRVSGKRVQVSAISIKAITKFRELLGSGIPTKDAWRQVHKHILSIEREQTDRETMAELRA